MIHINKFTDYHKNGIVTQGQDYNGMYWAHITWFDGSQSATTGITNQYIHNWLKDQNLDN